MPLYDNRLKVGFGLWNYPIFAFVLELAVLFVGMYLYLKTTESVARGGRYGIMIFGVLMLALQAFVFFDPPPSSGKAAAVTALVFYFVFAGVADWLEGKRAPLSSLLNSEKSVNKNPLMTRRH
jgi:hypothetical protein